MTLQNGSRVKGEYNGKAFTGTLIDYNHISTIELDRAIYDDSGRYTDRLYMYETVEIYRQKNNTNRGYFIEDCSPIPTEPTLLPLSEIAQDSLRKEFKAPTFSEYKTRIERRLTTYRTVKRQRTCEYGHKHMVDERQAVTPKLDNRQVALEFFFYCLAEYANYLAECEYRQQCEAWNRLARQFSLAGGKFCYAEYEGLDKVTAKRIENDLRRIYDETTDFYERQIFGANYGRHSRINRLFSKGN